MAGPYRVLATLPTLGTLSIDFHSESARLWEYIGDRERRRLRDVAHLGVAASVFTGINHSRLEYTLLQCAVIGQVGKLHKDEERLGLAGQVKLNGMAAKVSSAEELLKCWALLSNFGHAQYTYGTERSLLQYALKDPRCYSWLAAPSSHKDLNEWCRKALNNYDDEKLHFLLCLKRLACESPYDRRKTSFIHYIRNLVLPLEKLFSSDSTNRYKVGRLRELYRDVRLLSMVTLDSYYSGHPIRLQLGSAVGGLAGMRGSDVSPDEFDDVIRRMAGWLADELYLHPRAVAAQREYEVRALQQLPKRFTKALRSRDLSARFLREILHDGLGRPQPERLKPFIRLTFRGPRPGFLGRTNLYSSLRELEGELCEPPLTYLSIDRNRFSGSIHVDLLYRDPESTPADISRLLIKLRRWLTRTVEAESLASLRRVFPGDARATNRERMDDLRRRLMQRQLEENTELLARIFWATISYLLPQGWSGRVSEYIRPMHGGSPIYARITDSLANVYDLVLPRLDAQITAGPPTVTEDRQQELLAVRRVVSRSLAPLALVCSEKFIVRDQYGKHRDDWDGVIVEIYDDRVTLTVIEAKNLRHASKNESVAFKQLAETRDLVRQRHALYYRRQRIPDIGAFLRVSLSGP